MQALGMKVRAQVLWCNVAHVFFEQLDLALACAAGVGLGMGVFFAAAASRSCAVGCCAGGFWRGAAQ